MDIIWAVSRYVLPAITVIILIKCVLTLMLGHPKEKIYGYIIDMKSGNRYALNMWETSVGRSKSCDVVLPYDTVARSHAVITRRIDGWYIHDLLTKARLTVNGEEVSDLISLQMISTDVTVTPDKMVIKRAEKQGMFQALDVASVWLERMDRDGAK